MDIRSQVTTQISKSFFVEYTELIEELDGREENENLSYGLISYTLKKRLEEHYQILMEIRHKDQNLFHLN